MGVRARVVASFLVLLLAAEGMSLLVLARVGTTRIDEQVSRDLANAADDLRVRLASVQGTLNRPDGPTLPEVFEQHLRARPARSDQAFLTFVDQRPFAASAGAAVSLKDLAIAARWARLETTESGEVSTPAGPLRWVAVPVRSDQAVIGVFVATSFIEGQQEALRSTVVTVGLVTTLVLVGAGLLAWGAAGRALAPVRDLAATARSVSSGEDLSARLEITGTDEVGELTASFNQMLDNLQRAFDSQRRFLDGAAHELRAPITVVRGHVELLDDDPVQRQADVAVVLDEIDRMDRLVEELRVLARSERPDFLTTAPTDVGDLVSSIGRKAKAMGVRRWEVVDDVDAVVRADGQRLTQAVLGLVDNALHVTTDQDTIEIGGTVRGNDVVLWVRDTGPGIAADDLPTLFDREGRTVGRRPGGTGLGLPIVAAIARAHHGSVAATSRPGGGTRIEITLPRSAS